MRRIKKILCVFLTVILVAMSMSAMASAPVVTIDPENNAITVSGKLESETRKGDVLIFELKNSGGDIVYAGYTKTVFDEERNVVFEFDKLLLPDSLASDTYTIVVGGGSLESPMTTTYKHSGPDRTLSVLGKVNSAENVGAVLLDSTDGLLNAGILGADIDDYNGLNVDGKAAFEAILDEEEYNLVLPESYVSDADREKIKTALGTFLKGYKRGIAAGKFAMADDATDVGNWISSYYNDFGFNANEEITSVLNLVKGETDFARRISLKTSPMSIDEIKAYMYESALLSTIYARTDDEVKSVILDFPTYFPIDIAEFNSLSAVHQAKVISYVSGNVYDTCDDVVDAVNAKVDEYLNDDGDDSDGGNNRGNKYSPASGLNVSVNDKTDADTTIAEKPKFTDLHEASWAENAILFLCERGIVNGNPDGTFSPNNNITRAEFIKIVTVAINLATDAGDTSFIDVDANSWYAPYVAAAYKKGIVTGDDLGNFYPEAQISRQDMVTILYRTIKAKADGDVQELDFTDKDSISPYALSAVAYFNEIGVVKGFADGRFGPMENATRAEAAMVLYNLITASI